MGIQNNEKKLRNMLAYGGLSRAEFDKVRTGIAEENFKSIHLYSLIGFVAGVFLVLSECFIIGELSRIWLDVVLCFSMLAVNLLYRKNTERRANVVTIVMMIGMMTMGLVIAMNAPARQATSFLVLLTIVPLAFCVRPIITVGLVILFSILFIIMTVLFRDQSVLMTDVVNCIIYGTLSCILNTYIGSLKIKAQKMNYENRMISELDVLTGVNNLNSYKKFLENKPRISGVTCFYVDVNELHEFNIFRSHDEGDRLLIYLAAVLLEIFERGNVYRISGDEFVCFCRETDREKLKSLREKVEDRVKERNYSITMGWAATGDDMAVTRLVELAETSMLENKKKYYYKR